MSNAIYVASSTLSGGVLTVVYKVAADAVAVTNFDLTFNFDPAKVASISGVGPGAGFSDASNPTTGQFLLSSFMTGTTPVAPGGVLATLSITLANSADATLTSDYSFLYNDAGTIAATPVQLGDNLINSPVQGQVTIDGTFVENQVITANTSGLTDADGPGTYSYHWLRDGVEAGVTTSANYTLTDADVGHKISVQVTYQDAGGHTESTTSAQSSTAVTNVNDLPTGGVTVSGSASVGATLTAVTTTLADEDGVGTLSYQWLADGTVIAGATNSTYVLTAAELTKNVTVTVSYVDGHGTTETVPGGNNIGPVVPNQAPTGSVTIDNTVPKQGDVLTASNTLADADNIASAITYQWTSDGVAISGATGSSYTLTQADVTHSIAVVASYTDGLGKVEQQSSAPTSPVANVPDAPQGSLTISGTFEQNQTLTLSDNVTDADGKGTVNYIWLADGQAFGTGSSVVLAQAQVGKTITAQASYTDGFGANESVTSSNSGVVANVNDPAVGSLMVSGTYTQGQTLSVTPSVTDADGMGTFSYQWLADGVAIAGATSSSYTLTQGEVGKHISVTGTYVDGFGQTESVTSGSSTETVANVNDAPTGAPTLSGIFSVNQVLTANTSGIQDLDGVGTFSYQWFAIRPNTSAPVALAGETNASYHLLPADEGSTIYVQVSYTDGGNTTETLSSAPSPAIIVNNLPTGSVTVSGSAVQNQTLTAVASLGDLDGIATPITIQWLSDGVAIDGATGATFTLTEAEVGHAITARASYVDSLGTAESVTSSPTAAVANVNDPVEGDLSITGALKQGAVLFAGEGLQDADGMGTISWQWFANGAAIAGATDQALTLTQAQVGKTITVSASYTDGHGTKESKTSAAAGPVANVNDVATGVPTINNTAPSQGQTLTVNTSAIQDLDGLGTFNFQWMAGGVAITGATSSSLALSQAQVGKEITVRVDYTDGFGTHEFLGSAATSPVANVNDAPTGAVNVDGAKVVGLPLTADTSAIADADGLGTFSFQWMRGTTAIAGATSATYTPVSADAGNNLTVAVSYKDGFGTSEVVNSAAIAILTEDNVQPLQVPGATSVAGDGNGDGVKDSEQVAVVSAPLTIQGVGTSAPTYVTLVADSSSTGGVNTGSTAVIQTLDQEVAPTTKPGKMAAPLGLIDFTATTTTGQTETFSLFVDKALHVNGYWKQDHNGTWVNLASKPFGGSTTNVGNKIRLDFKITDGGEFDNDHKADGVITDPAIIGEMALSLVGYTPDVTLTPTTHFFF